MRIILVEDSALDALVICEALKTSRISSAVSHVEDAEDALQILCEDASGIDIVLSDYHLPTMSGLELHRALIEKSIQIPFVLLTGHGAEELAVKALKAGVQEYLAKDLEGHYLQVLPQLLTKAVRAFQLHLRQVESETQQRLAAAVFECALEAIVVADSNKTINHVNPAFIDTTAFKKPDIIGSNLSVLFVEKKNQILNPEIWHTVDNETKWQGETVIRCNHGRHIPAWLSISQIKDKHGNVVNYIIVFSNISKLVEAEKVIRYRANYDLLTDLPNRALFEDRLKQSIRMAEREKNTIALMLIDLDHFKEINDRHGHLAGDFVLKTVASRMLACVRTSDTVSRLAGDEFTITLDKIAHNEDATTIAKKLLVDLARPIRWQQIDLKVSGSIGIALFPDHGRDIHSLIRNADAAMYRSKNEGRNAFNFVTDDFPTSMTN